MSNFKALACVAKLPSEEFANSTFYSKHNFGPVQFFIIEKHFFETFIHEKCYYIFYW